MPFFKDKALDRISEAGVTRLLARLARKGRKPKTIRNIASTLHSLFDLALRRRWIASNPCKLVDLPTSPPSDDIRFLTQDELMAVIDRGIDGSPWSIVERPLAQTEELALPEAGHGRHEVEPWCRPSVSPGGSVRRGRRRGGGACHRARSRAATGAR